MVLTHIYLAPFTLFNISHQHIKIEKKKNISVICGLITLETKEKVKEYGQGTFYRAQRTNDIGEVEKAALSNLESLAKNGLQKGMMKNKLCTLVAAGGVATPYPLLPQILATGGFRRIIVPAGYIDTVPFGVCFGALRGSEPKLIEIAFAH